MLYLFFGLFSALMDVNGQTDVQLLKDINIYQQSPPFSDPRFNPSNPDATLMAYANGFTFFFAYDALTGSELWKTNGNAQSTVLVKDLSPGSTSSKLNEIISVGNKVFFIANDLDLWVTDGTENGTALLKSFQGQPVEKLTAFNGIVLFVASTSSTGKELWKSDGTSAGTVLVKDINSGTANSNPAWFTQVNSLVYFSAQTSADGTELWKTDGTDTGTTIVIDLASGSSNPTGLVNANGMLYFTAVAGIRQLFKSDGTLNGTVAIDVPINSQALNPAYAFGDGVILIIEGSLVFVKNGNLQPTVVKSFTENSVVFKGYQNVFKGKYMFVASDMEHGMELWESDGTDQGTKLLKDINPGPSNGITSETSNYPIPRFTAAGDLLYFVCNSNSGYWLAKSDGTSEGTSIINYGFASPFTQVERMLSTPQGAYFMANDFFHGMALWKTNGTAEGTVMVKDLRITVGSSNPTVPTLFKGNNYFAASSGELGTELWKTNGTAEGTSLLKDISTYNWFYDFQSSYPQELTVADNHLFFFASDSVSGKQLWKTDGATEETVKVTDIPNYSLYQLATLNNKLMFTSYHNPNFYLWFSDGTKEGTVQYPTQLSTFKWGYSFGSYYLMAMGTAETGTELWITDGTVAGTSLLKEINSGPNESNPRGFSQKDGIVYFQANDGVHGYEYWRTDGTTNGTYMLKDICPGACSSDYGAISTEFNGPFYFTAKEPTHGYCMYKTDGTEAGTSFVFDPRPGYQLYGGAVNFKYVDGKIFYLNVVVNENGGFVTSETWVMDEAGQHSKLGVHRTSFPAQFSFRNAFYTLEQDPVEGIVLWKTDGTAAGTVELKGINPGSGVSTVSAVSILNDAIYFIAGDGILGNQLWKSDGDCKTVKITNVPGNVLSYYIMNNRMILTIDHRDYGTELFYYDLVTEPGVNCPVEQEIVFNEIPQQELKDMSYTAVVSATSGLPVTLSASDEEIVNIIGNKLIFLKAGNVDITATQPGDANFLPAEPITRTLEIVVLTAINSEVGNGLIAYPNPVNQILTIETDQPLEEITASDILGRTVQLSSNDRNVDMSPLPDGVYLIRCRNKDNNIISIRIVKK